MKKNPETPSKPLVTGSLSLTEQTPLIGDAGTDPAKEASNNKRKFLVIMKRKINRLQSILHDLVIKGYDSLFNLCVKSFGGSDTLVAKKDSLWVKWVTIVKLKGRSVWEMEKHNNDSWMWKSLLDLRSKVRKHMQYKVGNGCLVSMWHDQWSMLPPLDSILSRREIYAAGFSIEDYIPECIHDNNWRWHDHWLLKYPMLCQYVVPNSKNDVKDKLLWYDCTYLILIAFLGWPREESELSIVKGNDLGGQCREDVASGWFVGVNGFGNVI
ncbi:hypothetical protein Tco_0509471 [Tanacetum coccineum]